MIKQLKNLKVLILLVILTALACTIYISVNITSTVQSSSSSPSSQPPPKPQLLPHNPIKIDSSYDINDPESIPIQLKNKTTHFTPIFNHNNNNNNKKQIEPSDLQSVENSLRIDPEDEHHSNTLIIVLSNDVDILEILNRFLDYKTSYSSLVISRVFVLGKRYQFNEFHTKLDEFLQSHRLYKPAYHPKDYQPPYLKNQWMLLTELRGLAPDTSNIGRLYKKIDSFQFPYETNPPIDCKHQKIIYHELKYFGLFSALHFIPYNFFLGLTQYRMSSLQQNRYQYGNWQDVFFPISKCDFQKINTQEIAHVFEGPVPEDDIVYYPVELLKGFQLDSIQSYFKSEYQLEYLDLLSIVFDWMVRPLKSTRSFISDQISQLFGGNGSLYSIPRCVSIHVRHGDKFVEAPPIPFSTYIETLAALNLDRLGIHDIFLMTDNPEVIEMTRDPEVLGKSLIGKRFHYIEQDRQKNQTLPASHYFDPSVPKQYYSALIYSEVTIASQCEIFIGTLSSNIGRAVIEFANTTPNIYKKSFTYINLEDFSYYIN
eukprot:gene6740-8357_t